MVRRIILAILQRLHVFLPLLHNETVAVKYWHQSRYDDASFRSFTPSFGKSDAELSFAPFVFFRGHRRFIFFLPYSFLLC
jgi:hypothetical protein